METRTTYHGTRDYVVPHDLRYVVGKCEHPDGCDVNVIDQLTIDHFTPQCIARSVLLWDERVLEGWENKNVLCRKHHSIKDAVTENNLQLAKFLEQGGELEFGDHNGEEYFSNRVQFFDPETLPENVSLEYAMWTVCKHYGIPEELYPEFLELFFMDIHWQLTNRLNGSLKIPVEEKPYLELLYRGMQNTERGQKTIRDLMIPIHGVPLFKALIPFEEDSRYFRINQLFFLPTENSALINWRELILIEMQKTLEKRNQHNIIY